MLSANQLLLIGLLPSKTDVVATGYSDILEKLEKFLSTNVPYYKYINTTFCALKICIQDYDIDLLLSPRWESQEAFYSHLRTVPEKKRLM